MVSSLDFNCETVHVGVTRRSVRNVGAFAFAFVFELGEVMMTEISVGVGWKAILSVRAPRIYSLIFFISDLIDVLVEAGVECRRKGERG